VIALSYLPGHINFRAIDSCYDCPFKNVSIYSNTIYNGNSSNPPIRIFPSAQHITNLRIANNIITGTAYYLLSFQELRSTEITGRLTLTNNLYYRFGGTGHNLWKDGTDKSWGTDYLLTDPKYINKNTLNLKLQITSPAIDSGKMSAAAPIDFDELLRPFGTTADIGAYEYYETNADTTPPVISDIQMQTSNQLDIEIGWENITCNAIDNVAIEKVTFTYIDTNYHSTTKTLLKQTGTSIYYYNTTLTQSGNYTYYLSAKDTNNNRVNSNTMKLSLPPNWDINNDGRYTILDKVLISVCYGQTGAPGWIREDINNNGIVNMVDLTYDSNHYNEHWWD
jgi:hypothetical protein